MTAPFSFGQAQFGFGQPAASTAQPAPANPSTGTLGFGVSASKPSTFGFSAVPVGALSASTAQPAAAITSTGTLGFGVSAAKPSTFTFGGIPVGALSASDGNKLGGTPNLTAGGQKPTGLGSTISASAAALPTATKSAGLTLSIGGVTNNSGFGAATTTTSGGLTLGTSAISKPGFGLATTTSSGGLTLGTSATSKPGFGLQLGTTALSGASASGGLTLGGLGGTNTAPITTASTVVKGLGGVDPDAGTANANKTAGASGDGKKVKEGDMPNELVETVTKFKEYVKEQKEIGAKISAVSSQQMSKVQDQTKSLKHSLSTVTTGLHRNIVALDKLKKQTSQELHNVEMAHRTKETPAGLQYENYAPNVYFHELLEAFDSRMALYRKLIEDTEGYLVGTQQGASVSPQDLFNCLKRLHETFIALAAQLQGIHEQIKEQKEHYLAYRKIFHNDEVDIFEKRRKAGSDKSKLLRTSQPLGPTPFTGLSNYAAMLMSTAINRQAPQPQTAMFGAPSAATQPPTTGLFGNSTMSTTGFGGFGAATSQPTGLFGAAANSTATKPLGFGFGSTAATTAPPAFGFPSATTSSLAGKPLGFGFGSAAVSAAPTFGFGTASTAKPTGFGFGTSGAFGSTPAQSTSLFGASAKPLG